MDYPNSVPSVGLVGGKFVDEDVVAGTPGSLIPAQWGNAVTDEILNVITTAGLEPDEEVNTQLAAAISQIIGANRPLATQAEAEAGNDNSKMMTPLRTQQSISKRAAVVGSARNVRMDVAAASVTASVAADEIFVKSSLGGLAWLLSSFNKTINLAGANGIGAMRSGTAPISGYVAIYAALNPSTGDIGLFGENASSSVVPEVAASTPAGYTATALISVWPTNASGQFLPGNQRGREVALTTGITVLSGTALSTTFGPLAISSAVPQNAKSVGGTLAIQATAGSGGISMNVASDANGTGSRGINGASSTSNGLAGPFESLTLATVQLIYFNGLVNGPTAYADTIVISRYSF